MHTRTLGTTLFTLSLCTACTGAGPGPDAGMPVAFKAISFNTGTSEGMGHDDPPDDGYGEVQAGYSDLYYGDGLAWQAVVDDVRAFLDVEQPDIIGFQEMFFSDDCANIPAEARTGFVCETWSAGDRTVANVILGEGYRVACHQEKNDKCVAVKKDFASIPGCDDDLCLSALDGFRVDGCGSGSRVGRTRLTLDDASELTVVHVHGSSGMTADDMDCRRRQFEQIWVDFGDGAPAADGDVNLILGDFNTDPGRLAGADPSADEILKHVGTNKPFDFLNDVGEAVTGTYAGLFNIDHAISDALTGSCESAGIDGRENVSAVRYFDHKPLICALSMP
jgi:hypothetical protein